ncbi:hypothetical protein [Burkholderia cepacia]|uniref:hypothetical protein n=1 Tax=Burkholderia cepacia TaxID=292 RepID=UPI002AB7C4E6|nr:hypothetical protein [Burkholderia cepacia]
MSKYAKLDALVLSALGATPISFATLMSGEIKLECEVHAVRDAFRVLDRRLQALKKLNQVRFDGKGWVKP